jgi:hypothetical protein
MLAEALLSSERRLTADATATPVTAMLVSFSWGMELLYISLACSDKEMHSIHMKQPKPLDNMFIKLNFLVFSHFAIMVPEKGGYKIIG